MHHALNPYIVSLSIVVGVMTSYTMLDMSSRIRRMEAGARRTKWLAGAALIMGNGIWSMHFIGMLASRMLMHYDLGITAASHVIAVATAYLALRITTHAHLGSGRLACGGFLMGTGVVAMHYVGMSAIEVSPPPHYHMGLFVLSIAIALTASWAALWIGFRLGYSDLRWWSPARWAAALVMGLAIAGMHYVGMSATVMEPAAVFDLQRGMATPELAIIVGVWSMCAMTASVVMAAVGSSLERMHLCTRAHVGHGFSPSGLASMIGIADRTEFLERLELRVVQAREQSEDLGVMFLDLDCFKTVNDSLGLSAGDDLLKAFAIELKRRLRPDTLMGCMGGDEFTVLIEKTKEADDVLNAAKSIFGRLEQNFEIDGMALRVTASAGVAAYPAHGATAGTLIKSANLAMHHAKRQGKNSCCFFDPAMSDAASRTLQINRGMGEALEEKQFSLVFQPKFDGTHYRVSGAEALIRWRHPVMGMISPMEFIPAAEETGQIVQIGEWVIGEVCRQMKVWEGMGLPVLRIAINLSAAQLRQEHYAAKISRIVADAGVDPGSILFEITETAAMREPKLAAEVIRDFQRAGFDFAIDDFGTGYSSMAYLQQFRVKELKIDRFFINSLESNGEEGDAIVSAIIALAHALNMTVVAEGVETQSQLNKLGGMHCDEIQGYLLGRPLSPADFEKFVRIEAGLKTAGDEAKAPALLKALESAIA